MGLFTTGENMVREIYLTRLSKTHHFIPFTIIPSKVVSFTPKFLPISSTHIYKLSKGPTGQIAPAAEEPIKNRLRAA